MSDTHPEPFVLDATLGADSLPIASLSLCDVRLINDARFLWCLVVPRLPDLRDWTDVPRVHKQAFQDDVERVCVAVKTTSSCDKLNVASLGNVVEQLHVHVIARHRDDAAWPAPVWGLADPEPYTKVRLSAITHELVNALTVLGR